MAAIIRTLTRSRIATREEVGVSAPPGPMRNRVATSTTASNAAMRDQVRLGPIRSMRKPPTTGPSV
jgi:hypothetical protein